MSKFIHIQSSKFPIMPGEEDELINEGMYGKSLALYLQEKLSLKGYETPFVCCEDWGWWVELRPAPFAFGVCVYSSVREGEHPFDFACTDSTTGSRQWSWKKFRSVETRSLSEKLRNDLLEVFESDSDIRIVAESEDYPL